MYMYAEIIDNEVKNIHPSLPIAYKNISNFFALNNGQLSDLSWSGNSGVKFYEYIPPEPHDNNFIVESVSYTINEQEFKVYGLNNLIPAPTPEIISARQIRLWLLQNGISLQMVYDAIATIEDPITRDSVSIEWEYAPYIERSHPMLVPLGQALGLSEADIDRGFTEAVNI
jgi:hypothetical protein